MGVYISQDPLGLKGGMPNLYSYVYDVNLMIDSLGLAGIVTSTLTVIKDGVKKLTLQKVEKRHLLSL